jgi:hypothetical protein
MTMLPANATDLTFYRVSLLGNVLNAVERLLGRCGPVSETLVRDVGIIRILAAEFLEMFPEVTEANFGSTPMPWASYRPADRQLRARLTSLLGKIVDDVCRAEFPTGPRLSPDADLIGHVLNAWRGLAAVESKIDGALATSDHEALGRAWYGYEGLRIEERRIEVAYTAKRLAE